VYAEIIRQGERRKGVREKGWGERTEGVLRGVGKLT
jgi:hypothetical protein